MHAPSCCPNALQWRWRLCVDLRLLNYGTGVTLTVHEQRVRLHCFVCALELELRVYWQYQEVIIWASYAISLSTYTTIMAMTALCRLSFVERMERVSCCPWTNRPYVRIAVCCSNLKVSLVFDTVCGRNVTLIIYTHYNGNDGSALIFLCWMYGTTVVVLALKQQLVRLYCCVRLNLNVLVINY